MLTLSGVFKDILLVCASVILYASPISLTQVFGYGVALVGLFRYKTQGKTHAPILSASLKEILKAKKKSIFFAIFSASLVTVCLGLFFTMNLVPGITVIIPAGSFENSYNSVQSR